MGKALSRLENDTAGHGYCGPTAISFITGKPLSAALDAIRSERGQTTSANRPKGPGFRLAPVHGTYPQEVLRALAAMGWKATRVPLDRKTPKQWSVSLDDFAKGRLIPDSVKRTGPTLAAFLRTRPPELMNAYLLIEVTRHFVVVKGRKFADTKTNGEPVFISKAPGRRKRVKAVWVVTKA